MNDGIITKIIFLLCTLLAPIHYLHADIDHRFVNEDLIENILEENREELWRFFVDYAPADIDWKRVEFKATAPNAFKIVYVGKYDVKVIRDKKIRVKFELRILPRTSRWSIQAIDSGIKVEPICRRWCKRKVKPARERVDALSLPFAAFVTIRFNETRPNVP